ncbi:MAG TPA: AAA family ATPase, partial [Chloroflexaceae bacterium]|nr:AAA family ATPase [Chloroflexaceae bacterium]
ARPNLDLLAADESLLTAQPAIARRPDWPRVLEQALAPIKRSYEFIIIDCGGSLTVLNLNALHAASDVVVPTTVEPFSLKGLEMLVAQIGRVKGGAGSLRAIVPTMFDPRTRQSLDLLTQLRDGYGAIVTAPIRVNVRLSESSAQGRTIYEYDPRSRGALDYALLVEHLSALWGFGARRPEPAQAVVSPAPQAPAPPAPPAATAREPAPAVASVRPEAPAAPPPEAVPAFLPPAPQAPVRPEAPAAPPPQRPDPVVTGAGSLLSTTCPNCGGPLRRATVAGYRVAYCDHCRYRRQELVSGARR